MKEDKPKMKTLEIQGKTTLKCGRVSITDDNKPFSTHLTIDGHDMSEIYVLTSLKYEIKATGRNAGKHKLTIEYYPRAERKDDKKETV